MQPVKVGVKRLLMRMLLRSVLGPIDGTYIEALHEKARRESINMLVYRAKIYRGLKENYGQDHTVNELNLATDLVMSLHDLEHKD